MDPFITGVLTKLTADAFLAAVRASWKNRLSAGAHTAESHEELTEAYELALRLLGSLLFEAHANILIVRRIVENGEKQGTWAVCDFSISEALMPDFCKVVTTPLILEQWRFVNSAIRRVDFYQRAAAQDHKLYFRAFAFAQDSLFTLRVIERFNWLVDYGRTVGQAIYKSSDLEKGWGGLLPERLEPLELEPQTALDDSRHAPKVRPTTKGIGGQ